MARSRPLRLEGNSVVSSQAVSVGSPGVLLALGRGSSLIWKVAESSGLSRLLLLVLCHELFSDLPEVLLNALLVSLILLFLVHLLHEFLLLVVLHLLHQMVSPFVFQAFSFLEFSIVVLYKTVLGLVIFIICNSFTRPVSAPGSSQVVGRVG